jgi:Fe2+ transport system protein FeoA
LTEKGEERAKDVLRKHLVLENYFKVMRNRKDAHKTAHVLEHYISEEIVRNLKKLSTFKEGGIPLTELKSHIPCLITDITLPCNKLFERIVSMGILPGEKIRLINKSSSGLIIEIKAKKIALDENIAKEIKVLEYGNS